MDKYVYDAVALFVGGIGGAADQLAEEQDVKNESIFLAANPGKKYPFYKKGGTYVNIAVPVVELGAVLINEMGDRPFMDDMVKGMLLAQAGGLAARKGTAALTMGPKKNYNMVYIANPPKTWRRDAVYEAAERMAATRAAMFEVQDPNQILV